MSARQPRVYPTFLAEGQVAGPVAELAHVGVDALEGVAVAALELGEHAVVVLWRDDHAVPGRLRQPFTPGRLAAWHVGPGAVAAGDRRRRQQKLVALVAPDGQTLAVRHDGRRRRRQHRRRAVAPAGQQFDTSVLHAGHHTRG